MRSNEEWVSDLKAEGTRQAAALEDLRALLLRGALYTFQRNLGDFRNKERSEVLDFAEDCAQEALITILSKLDEFRGDSKFTTWAYKFAVNIALTAARRERWRGVSLDEFAQEGEFPDWIRGKLQSISSGNNPNLAVYQGEVWAVLQDILHNKLTPRQRLAVKLLVFDEVPMDVVVERLDTNRNAIYKLLHDARLKMKQELESRGFAVTEVISLFGA